MTETILIPTGINNSEKSSDTTGLTHGSNPERFSFTFAGFIAAVLLLPVGFVMVSLGLYLHQFQIFLYAAHPLTGLAVAACVPMSSSEYVTSILVLWPLEWILYGFLIDLGISSCCSAKNVSADANPEADSSLTPEQTESLTKLEGLFRELPSARQRALLRKLRAEDTSQTAEGPESGSP
jgi:hypothetical protein